MKLFFEMSVGSSPGSAVVIVTGFDLSRQGSKTYRPVDIQLTDQPNEMPRIRCDGGERKYSTTLGSERSLGYEMVTLGGACSIISYLT